MTTMIQRSSSPRTSVDPDSVADPFAEILGESGVMVALRENVRRVARSSARTVLLSGESGTGKGLVARAIHDASDRTGGPFVPITCSAVPAHLLESELFGHEAGAFTDGKKRKIGLLESAEGGTVFLDEIGDMAPELQAKLLGVLEERKCRRIGGLGEVALDIRVVSATHRNLQALVHSGAFREDLYHRLCVVPLRVPALRERPEDIPMLAAFFVSLSCDGASRPRSIDGRALNLLRTRDWPGNVRELRNAVERAVVFSSGASLVSEDFEWRLDALKPLVPLPAEGLDVEVVVDDLVRAAMDRARGNQTAAAKLLTMTRNQLRYRLEKMGVLPRAGKTPHSVD